MTLGADGQWYVPKPTVYTRDLKLRAEGCHHREFVYREAQKPGPIQVHVPYYADTPENRAARFAHVCAGGKDNPMPPPLPEPHQYAHVRIIERCTWVHEGHVRQWAVQFWLMPHQYALARSPVEFGFLKFEHLWDLDESRTVRRLEEGILRKEGFR